MLLAEKPIIEQFDSGPYKWAEGQERNLTCKVVGAPTPIVSWTKDQQSLTGGRYITHDDGTLEVKVHTSFQFYLCCFVGTFWSYSLTLGFLSALYSIKCNICTIDKRL